MPETIARNVGLSSSARWGWYSGLRTADPPLPAAVRAARRARAARAVVRSRAGVRLGRAGGAG
eukprot:118290-Prymnesium_polylepis.1